VAIRGFIAASVLRTPNNGLPRIDVGIIADQLPSALEPWPRVFKAKRMKARDRILSAVVQPGACIRTSANSETRLQIIAATAKPYPSQRR
jgi:hypothetical protein